jgi:hypothetical protein
MFIVVIYHWTRTTTIHNYTNSNNGKSLCIGVLHFRHHRAFKNEHNACSKTSVRRTLDPLCSSLLAVIFTFADCFLCSMSNWNFCLNSWVFPRFHIWWVICLLWLYTIISFQNKMFRINWKKSKYMMTVFVRLPHMYIILKHLENKIIVQSTATESSIFILCLSSTSKIKVKSNGFFLILISPPQCLCL